MEYIKEGCEDFFNTVLKKAESGDAGSQTFLGLIYEQGSVVRQDYKKAIEWYTKAASQNSADAQFSLGNLYFFGNGVTQDPEEAFNWYKKAANNGSMEAQYSLGVIYANGLGYILEPDFSMAKYWLKKSADQGYTDAEEALRKLK